MQLTNGGTVVDVRLIEAFMDAYPCRDTIDRRLRLKPLFHWRMAVYCFWRTQFQSPRYPDYPEYRKAMEAEITAIERNDVAA